MIDIFCVLVKPKYTIDDVLKLYNSCKQFIDQPFRFVCLTDQLHIHDDIEFINVDHHELDTWWNKILVFSPAYRKNNLCLYFDIDVTINKNVTQLLSDIEEDKLTVVDTPWKDQIYFKQAAPFDTSAFLAYGNSSVMGWKCDSHSYLLNMLQKNIFKHTSEHFGDDTFIQKYGKIKYFNCKIYPYELNVVDAVIEI